MANNFNSWRRNGGTSKQKPMTQEEYLRHRMKTETRRAEARVLDPAKKTRRTVTMPKFRCLENDGEA